MKKFYWIPILFIYWGTFAQSNQLWKGYFSYNAIADISQGTNKVVAATDNALVFKNTINQEVRIKTPVDGYKPNATTIVHYSQDFGLTLTGSENGQIVVTKEDGTIVTKVDVINEIPVPPNEKKINHFLEHEGKIYIATDYGISVLNLSNLEFDDTFYIGTNGSTVVVYQTAILNNEIYAVTATQGIKKATLNNPFLIDFNQWQTFDSGFWNGIVVFNNQLIAANTNQKLYKYTNGVFQEIVTLWQPNNRLRASSDYLWVTTNNNVWIFNLQLTVITIITNVPTTNNQFTSAAIVNNKLYLGTKSYGLFESDIINPQQFTPITPNGPISNKIFRLKKTKSFLWAVYGGYDIVYTPNVLEQGISKYSNTNQWEIIPFSDLQGATSLSWITAHPTNENEVYISSYHNGLLRIKNNEITLYNQLNTGTNGLESLFFAPDPSYKSVRIGQTNFDKEGHLWMTNAYLDKPLKVLRNNGQWQSYDLSNDLTEVFFERFSNTIIDKNNTKWMGSFRANGLVAFNESYNNKTIVIKGEEGNIPSNDVRCLALDNRNQLWIGTYRGLRVLPSIDRFLTETELEANAIIIDEDGLAQELFYQQSILDIAVDGANNKWISIADAGVFLVSPNGQRTIHRFTSLNSPLPSDNVIDIEIDGVTGEVFFATEKGLISFLGINTKPKDNLTEVYVYPNPVRPNFSDTVKITNLTDRATVKITDIEGNLVFETTSAGGTIEWDTKAFGKHKVASGVYMIFISDQDGIEVATRKLMIVR